MKKIKEILATQTLKKSSITFAGTIVNALFGAIFYILAARYLGPSGFGILSVALLVMTLTADVGELGMGMGIVNFVPKLIQKDRDKAFKYLKLALQIKIVVWIIIFVIGILTAGFVAKNLFNKPELEGPLEIAFFGVLAMLLFSFITQTLQAVQKFWSWSVIQVVSNLARLLVFVSVFYFGLVNVNNTLLVYIIVPLLAFLIGLKIIGTDFIKAKNPGSVFKDFFKYNIWTALFTIFAATSARMDTFISARLLDASEVGIYSASNQLVKIVPQIVLALGTVIGPKMASLSGHKEFLDYFKKTQVLVFGLAVLGLLSVPFVIYLIPFIFGSQYLASVQSFIVLFFAMLVFLMSIPVHQSVFYYFSNSKLFAYIAFFHLLIVIFVGYYLIKSYGVIGASYTVLIAQIFDFVVPAIWVFRKMNNK